MFVIYSYTKLWSHGIDHNTFSFQQYFVDVHKTGSSHQRVITLECLCEKQHIPKAP